MNRSKPDFDPADYRDVLDRYDAKRWGDEVPYSLLRALEAAPIVGKEEEIRCGSLSPVLRGLRRGELEVLLCAARGFGLKKTAAVLGLSVGTVLDHRRSARVRLGARTTTHAVALAHRLGFAMAEGAAGARLSPQL